MFGEAQNSGCLSYVSCFPLRAESDCVRSDGRSPQRTPDPVLRYQSGLAETLWPVARKRLACRQARDGPARFGGARGCVARRSRESSNRFRANGSAVGPTESAPDSPACGFGLAQLLCDLGYPGPDPAFARKAAAIPEFRGPSLAG
uniref:Uncharacterized protein n=1 Tax=Panagrolaimus superbus TaxID=310955 RepID=A0A914YE21_9BILA